MSISLYVVGLRPVDDKWRKMKAAWDACSEAGFDAPEIVKKFFDYVYPKDENAIEVKIDIEKYSAAYRHGYEIDLSTLPDDVTKIRCFLC